MRSSSSVEKNNLSITDQPVWLSHDVFECIRRVRQYAWYHMMPTRKDVGNFSLKPSYPFLVLCDESHLKPFAVIWSHRPAVGSRLKAVVVRAPVTQALPDRRRKEASTRAHHHRTSFRGSFAQVRPPVRYIIFPLFVLLRLSFPFLPSFNLQQPSTTMENHDEISPAPAPATTAQPVATTRSRPLIGMFADVTTTTLEQQAAQIVRARALLAAREEEEARRGKSPQHHHNII